MFVNQSKEKEATNDIWHNSYNSRKRGNRHR